MSARLRTAIATAVRTEILPGVWLDSRLAVWLAAPRILVLADPHWGYAASHRARGNLLPLWGDDELAARIGGLVADYQPAEMIWLGDIVHAAEGGARVEQFLREAPMPVALLAGNHDRRWKPARERVMVRGRFLFHHGDVAQPVPRDAVELIGHHHPAVTWGDQAGSRLKLPALVAGPRRLILPAFSPWAAGTPWNDRVGPPEQLWAIAPNRIFAFSRRNAATAEAS